MIKHDDFGPEKLIEVYDSKTKMVGYLVIDNTWLGVAKGGLRMTPNVSLDEVYHLARTMTYKNALAELPFGGGKAGIRGDVKSLSAQEKLELVKAFSRAIKNVTPSLYVTGPDVGTTKEEMAAFVEANGSLKSATGKPAEMCVKPGEECGIPHEFGSTGFGVVESTLEGLNFLGEKIKGKSVAVAGFGNVGTYVVDLLFKEGAKIVAISDSGGTTYDSKGLDIKKIFAVKKENGTVAANPTGKKLDRKDIFNLPVDILIPAALGGVITDENVAEVKAKLIVEAANLAVREDAEIKLFKRDILVIPDIIANAGGVISSYAEYRGYNPKQMFQMVKRKIRKNTKMILEKAKKEKETPRESALKLAKERLFRAKKPSR